MNLQPAILGSQESERLRNCAGVCFYFAQNPGKLLEKSVWVGMKSGVRKRKMGTSDRQGQ